MAEVIRYASQTVLPPRDVGRPFLIAGFWLLICWTFGAAACGTGWLICPAYFGLAAGRTLVGLPHGLLDHLARGLFEGTLGATVALLALLPWYCGVTGCRYPVTRFAWFSLISAIVAGAACIVVGAIFTLWAAASPSGFDLANSVCVPSEERLRFAFVLGARWGEVVGLLLGMAFCAAGIIRGWRSLLARATALGADGVLAR